MNARKFLVAHRILASIALVGAGLPIACGSVPENEMSLSAEMDRLLQDQYAERVAAKPNDIRGQVLSTAEEPLEGVTVHVAGKSVKTNALGEFVVPDVPQGTHLITFEHIDYVTMQQTLTAVYESDPIVSARMLARSPERTFNADIVNEINEGPLTLKFEPGDLVIEDTGKVVHGMVAIRATAIEPGRPGHIKASPAPLAGINTQGKVTALYSAGMLEVELTQDGHHVQVREGQTVDMRMKVAAGVDLADETSIPMWHHDTTSGMWVQQADLYAKVEPGELGRVATAALPHFSGWNIDAAKPSVCTFVLMPNAIGIRTVSVSGASGAEDGYWSLTGECQMNGSCVVNAPSSWGGSNVWFKYQVQVPIGTTTQYQWCDLKLDLFANQPAVAMQGTNLGAYVAQTGGNDDSYCGTSVVTMGNTGSTSGWAVTLSGAFNALVANPSLGTLLTPYEPNANSLTLANSLVCPSTPPGMIATDSGRASMSTNALTAGRYQNVDMDSYADTQDACRARSNALACNKTCYVAPVPANLPASPYDSDRDTVHNFCDNKMNIYNPTQYTGQ